MLEFHPITKDVVPTFMPYLEAAGAKLCDFAPVNLFAWAGYFYKSFAIADDMLFLELFTEDGDTAFAVPMGTGDVKNALCRLKTHTDVLGKSLTLSLVTADDLPLLREVFGELHGVYSESEWSDYVYDAKAMAAFEGSAYSKQRNHVRRFERCYQRHRVEALRTEHVADIHAFLDCFAALRGKEGGLAAEEITRAKAALADMERLLLFGVVLYVEDKLVGFSAGSRIGDMLFVNFEKADTAFDGVYQKLVKAFASHYVDGDVRFINREEDCGDAGLRKSKLAYHPITLLEKYTVTISR